MILCTCSGIIYHTLKFRIGHVNYCGSHIIFERPGCSKPSFYNGFSSHSSWFTATKWTGSFTKVSSVTMLDLITFPMKKMPELYIYMCICICIYIYIYVYVYSYLENPSFSDMPKIMLLVRYPIISHQIYTITQYIPNYGGLHAYSSTSTINRQYHYH